MKGSGIKGLEFGRWIKTRRAPEWVLRMVEFLPMSTAVYDELIRFAALKTADPAIRARQKHAAKVLLDITPELSEELVDKGLAPLAHQFERRLGRRLSDKERQALRERLAPGAPCGKEGTL